jgi:hypothetical protein
MIPPALASFRLTTCEFMAEKEATFDLFHSCGTKGREVALPMSGNRTSQRSCSRHVPPKNGNFKYAPLIRANGRDQAFKISSALAVSICSEKCECVVSFVCRTQIASRTK